MLTQAENPWGLDLWILRAETGASHTGGNKGYKLRGYFDLARQEGIRHMITMAGPYSNHLRAFAALTRREGLGATAIVRGDELIDASRHSDELRFALGCGVRLIFADRQAYRALRETSTAAERSVLVPDVDFAAAGFVPEGGLGPEGLIGVADWAAEATGFDAVVIPCATGTTCAGFLAATRQPTRVIGVAVLRNFAAVHAAISRLVPGEAQRFTLVEDYAAQRFGRPDGADDNILDFARENGLVADTIYTVRALRALRDYALSKKLFGRVLLVYTYNE